MIVSSLLWHIVSQYLYCGCQERSTSKRLYKCVKTASVLARPADRSVSDTSRAMKKQEFCLCKNSNCTAYRHPCVRCTDSTIKLLAIFCGCRGWFVSGLVGISEALFSHLAAHIVTGFTCSDPANIPMLII